MSTARATGSDNVEALGARLIGTIESVVAGKPETIEITVATLLSQGNLLIEDIPGVGKTLLAQALALAVGGSFKRIQGTSDLLPGDVTGSMVPGNDGHTMTFRPGPVFANIVVFDELNRATPRTQSALLELAEEATVTVDGVSHDLPRPFMLVATQNPIDIAGTYGLGEGALDRFGASVTPGRAAPDSELEVLTGRRGRSVLDAIEPVTTLDELADARLFVSTVHVADAIAHYVVELLEATRNHPKIRLGASTRAGVSVIALARARAVLRGRDYVTPDDVVAVAVPALAHRVAGSNATVTDGRSLVAECLAGLSPPSI
ncbi:MAG: MoxR family ATPase [Ilumatobacteraceae bacterium]|nr:MoxR family ATPase [Ilumatobacteraceae bacterium]